MATLPLAQTLPVIAALRRRFRQRALGEPGPLGPELTRVLELLADVEFQEGLLEGHAHPVAGYLATASAAGATPEHEILRLFQPLAQALPWRYSYESRADLPDIGQRMAWAELVGPAAPFRSDAVCLGLTVIGPQVRYPEHAHPAVEVYYVLSGLAQWIAAGLPSLRPPGSFILHPSNVVHVMETLDEPLIAVYTWSGEVVTLSSYT